MVKTKDSFQPLIVFNLKTFAESTGKNSQKLLNAIEHAASSGASSEKFQFAVAPAYSDLHHAVNTCKHAFVLSQHVDSKKQGQSTGSFPAGLAKQIGCNGTLLNHSEHPLHSAKLRETIELCKSLGLYTIACASSVAEAKLIATMKPSAIAFEPPELIGTGVSVSTARVMSVTKFLALRKHFKGHLLIGAGVSNRSDLRSALRLGADGILLASAFAKAKEPQKWLAEFTS